jgi:hypothetical protein
MSEVQFPAGAMPLCPYQLRRLGHKADHLPPSSAKVKNVWSYTSTHPCVFMAWDLVKHRDKFIYTFKRFNYCDHFKENCILEMNISYI